MGMTVGWYNQMVKESESVINAQSMFKSYQTINFFSYPVFKAYAAVALGSLLFIFCSVFTLFAARKYRTVKQRRVKEND